MFGQSMNPAKAYSEVGVQTSVITANPHKLILMLFDGALQAVGTAAVALNTSDIATKGKSISKAIEIITSGLRASLDMEAGGQLAEQLGALYGYMVDRLLYANLHNSQAALDEVTGLLHELRDAWSEIGDAAEAMTA